MTILFSRRDKDWCLQALDFIEEGVAKNLTSANNQAQGGVSYASLDDAVFKISQLNQRIDELDRVAGIEVKPTTSGVIMRTCYGRRSWR
ncbi:hypothetical protein MOV66_10225 [Agrobacterium sp. SHOUNA12C]|nr:hypothetical protein [Agrobacterium sp. BETTINA12B]MCJ9757019.1 hypothetical protein [Agrobacterium sp. SHOUNA12C]